MFSHRPLGNALYTYLKGNATVQVMNALGYDLTTIGDHEWDDGQLKMMVVCANVDFQKTGSSTVCKTYYLFLALRS